MTHYCLHCGSRLVARLTENRLRETCPECGWINFLQLKVSAAALIEQEGKLLLARRSHSPWKGHWNLPAGYVEVDEQPAAAAEREAREETGLLVRATRLVEVYFFDDDPRGNGLLLLYDCRVIGGQPEITPEITALRFFGPDEIPPDLTGAAHDQIIQDWVEGRIKHVEDQPQPLE